MSYQRFGGCLVLFIGVAAGCGKTSSTAQFGDGQGGSSSGMGGSSGSSTAGRDGDSGTGGDGTDSSSGGGSAGVTWGGGSGAGVTGGGGTGPSPGGGSGNATNAAGATSGGATSGGAGGVSALDPRVEERRRLATEFCSLLETYPCLTYYGLGTPETRAEMLELCRLETEVQESYLGGECWDEWVALLECAVTAPYTCPCEDCILPSLGGIPAPGGEACAEEAWARIGCGSSGPGRYDIIDRDGVHCEYLESEEGCFVGCNAPPYGGFSADCMGPYGGAQSCTCNLNGSALCDEAGTDGSCYPWYAADCPSVAEMMADGQCSRIVSCCFTWTKDGTERCSCTADPTVAGFESCEATAAAGGGQVVELCPQYEGVEWDFPG